MEHLPKMGVGLGLALLVLAAPAILGIAGFQTLGATGATVEAVKDNSPCYGCTSCQDDRLASSSPEGFDWNEVSRLENYLIQSHRALLEDARPIAFGVHRAALKHDVGEDLILAIIGTESSYNNEAVSYKGAVGLMQLLPSTAREVAEKLSVEWSEDCLRDPVINIDFGTYYYKNLYRQFGDSKTALVAYNRGPYDVACRIASGGFDPHDFAYQRNVLVKNWPRDLKNS